MNDRRARLAVDIGGTFTDVVLAIGQDAELVTDKLLTTAAAPEQAVLDGVTAVLGRAGVAPAEVGLLVHGTTLATNALIERKGARTALLTTQGVRDVLETGYEKRFEHYDVFLDKPEPLVPRRWRFPVPERMSADGEVLLPLDEGALRGLARRLLEEDVRSVAIGFLHSYAHPAHEQRARDIVLDEAPGLRVTVSSEVCGEMREYERFSTACANAYVHPLMARYLERLQDELRRMGLACPLLMMMSGGGLTTLEQAARFPIRLVESGPAGGAILAGRIARRLGIERALAFDMGGTTAKICLLEKGEPDRARLFEVARAWRDLKGSGLPVRIPAIEMVEIGAGGGSIARVDGMGRIAVGPDSAGAAPGPASYGRGGEQATVTDANLALGKIDPERFAGGRIALQPERGEEALARRIGAPLGLDSFWPAAGIVEIVEENMANATSVHAIERGKVAADHTLIAFGGGAPLHAARLAQKLGIGEVVVPTNAGVGSAIGFLQAPLAYNVVRSRPEHLPLADLESVNAMLADMAETARAVVAPAAGDAPLLLRRQVDLRYLGQGHELTLDLPEGALTADDLAVLRCRFEALYGRIYGVVLSDLAVEAVTWSVALSTPVPAASPPPATVPRAAPPPAARRLVYDPSRGDMVETPIFPRPELAPGCRLEGPCVVAEDDTSTVVPEGFALEVDGLGYLHLLNRGVDR
jgi:N-methylhydantoinase A